MIFYCNLLFLKNFWQRGSLSKMIHNATIKYNKQLSKAHTQWAF